jgi:hypothetical protein
MKYRRRKNANNKLKNANRYWYLSHFSVGSVQQSQRYSRCRLLRFNGYGLLLNEAGLLTQISDHRN